MEGNPDVTDTDLITQLRTLVIESDRFAELFAESRAIHRTDLNALAVVMHADRAGRTLSPTQLAAALNLSASSVTALVDRMVAAGHLDRVRSATDRRRVDLHANQAALDVGRAFFAPLGAAMTEAFAQFGPDDRAVISRFLDAAIEATVRVRETMDAV